MKGHTGGHFRVQNYFIEPRNHTVNYKPAQTMTTVIHGHQAKWKDGKNLLCQIFRTKEIMTSVSAGEYVWMAKLQLEVFSIH